MLSYTFEMWRICLKWLPVKLYCYTIICILISYHSFFILILILLLRLRRKNKLTWVFCILTPLLVFFVYIIRIFSGNCRANDFEADLSNAKGKEKVWKKEQTEIKIVIITISLSISIWDIWLWYLELKLWCWCFVDGWMFAKWHGIWLLEIKFSNLELEFII